MVVLQQPARAALVMAVALGGLTACSSSSAPRATASSWAAPSSTPSTITTRATVAVPTVDWAALRNPILSTPDHAVKDPAFVAVGGKWVMRSSAVDAAGTGASGSRTRAASAHWSPMTIMPHDPTIEGEASPDVVPAPDGHW